MANAVLCGALNHGAFDWEDNPGSEFNGRSISTERPEKLLSSI